jgi:hypothetical protein
MLYLAIGLAAVAVALIVLNGLNSSALVKNKSVRWIVVFGSVIAAILSMAVIVETVWPAQAQNVGNLSVAGDKVALGAVSGGVLQISCTPNEGVNKKGTELQLRMLVKGAGGLQRIVNNFFLGEKLDEEDPRAENLATNVLLDSLGADAELKLTLVSPEDKVTIHVAYLPHRFPLRIALIALALLAVLAGAFEGALPASWRRTFLTTVVSCAALLGWLLENGFTVEDSFWTLWIRMAAAVAGGAIIGTLLPAIAGAMLPEFEQAERQDDPSTS